MFSENQMQRYSRQLILNGFGPLAQQKLLASRILVIGAGGLGSSALLYLAAAGAGTIGIADFDKVDISNLQRQILFCETDIGSSKTNAAMRRLVSLNSDIHYELHNEKINTDNIAKIVTQYEFIIDGTDSMSTKLLINDACVLTKKPFSHAGALGFGGQLMTVVPMQSACVRCIYKNLTTEEPLTCGQSGVLGAVVGVLGTLQALEAIKYVTGTGACLTNSVVSFQGDLTRFHTIKIAINPQCPICGSPRPVIQPGT